MFTQKPANKCLQQLYLPKLRSNPHVSSGEKSNCVGYLKKYYLRIKTCALLILTATFLTFKCIMLAGRSQTQKSTYCMIPFSWLKSATESATSFFDPWYHWLDREQSVISRVKERGSIIQW